MVAQSLAATIEAHPDCGVTLWGPRHLRDIAGFQATSKKLDEDIEPVDAQAAVALDELASLLARDVAAQRAQGIKTLILSEENFIGGMSNNFITGGFYLDVARKLAAYDSLLPMSPTRVALGVRDYGSVWTSAYHYLPQTGRPVPDLDLARMVLLDDKRGWPEVAQGARGVWPDSELLMWQQEHLSRDVAAICGQIMGVDPALVVTPEGKVNPRKSKTPKPDVFSPDERKHLTHRYNRHLRRMRNDGIGVWVGGEAAA